ncbi:MAG TPA: chemotaxis protein CheW [Rhizomicrobium sp.]|jgi:purine-binding chemotaxis protein CheW|nr:chemotaxis protein CheW [Rhizomicrobium sp.]
MTEQAQTDTGEGLTAFVTFSVADHYFGVPVSRVQDILTPDTIASVPLGPAEVRGLINLRGRIVTVIDVRTRLSLGASAAAGPRKCVTVESEGEFYTLLVDSVGDVVSLKEICREPNPATLDPLWCEVANGVFRAGEKLLVTLDVERLLNIRGKA